MKNLVFPWGDHKVMIFLFLLNVTGWLGRSVNEAKILHTLEKGLILQCKGECFWKDLLPCVARRNHFLNFLPCYVQYSKASTLPICFLRLWSVTNFGSKNIANVLTESGWKMMIGAFSWNIGKVVYELNFGLHVCRSQMRSHWNLPGI